MQNNADVKEEGAKHFFKNKMKNNLLTGVILSLVVIVFSAKAMAVPQLGIATDGPYYFIPADGFESYQDDWATSGIATSGGQDEGFEVNDGDTLYIWVTNNGKSKNDSYFTSDIYLLAEDDFTNVIFDGAALTDPFALTGTSTKIASYADPYSGINLGPVLDSSGSINTGWDTLFNVNPTADGYPGITYVYTGVIEFDLFGQGGDDYFFLAADLNGNGKLYDNGKDGFSPKTTSAVTSSVPEPTTVALLGIGLAGLAGAEVRRRRKKKTVDKS